MGRVPVIAGLAVVVVLITGFFLFRPTSDKTVDDTEIQATSETVLVEEVVPESGAASGETDSEELTLPAFRPEDLVPRSVDAPGELWQITRGDTGFFGLSFDPLNPVLQSVDGLVWSPIEGAAESLEALNLNSVPWSHFTASSDGLQMFGEIEQLDGNPRLVESETGAEWTEVDLGGPAESEALFDSAITNEALFGRVIGDPNRFDDFVRLHFDVDVPDDAICSYTLEPTGSTSFEILDCNGALLDTLDLTDMRDQSSVDQVVECLTAGADEVFAALSIEAWTLVRQDRQTNGERTTVRNLFGNDVPVTFPSGNMALIDSGFFVREPSGPCQGITDWPGPIEASIVVFDSETEQVSSWPFPIGKEPVPGSGSSTLQFLVGEAEVGESTHVLVYLAGDLYALEPESGEWSEPIIRDLARANGNTTAFALAESGNRLYNIDNEGVKVFRFIDSPDGSIDVVETILPFAEALESAELSNPTVYYADDQVVIFQGESGSWLLAIPEIPSQ